MVLSLVFFQTFLCMNPSLPHLGVQKSLGEKILEKIHLTYVYHSYNHKIRYQQSCFKAEIMNTNTAPCEITNTAV